MSTYNDIKYLSLPQQVEKNRSDLAKMKAIADLLETGPQGATGPRGATGVQGNTGAAGPDGTPASGLEVGASVDATYGGFSIDLLTIMDTLEQKTFIIYPSLIGSASAIGFNLYVDTVLQDDKISTVDFIQYRYTPAECRIIFYNENGEVTDYLSTASPTELLIQSTIDFSISEVLAGSTVGPTGPAGTQGIQGETGPTGATGIQGLTGPQNMLFLATYINEDIFPEYDYRVFVQCIGGEYDGMTFIKETMNELAVCKFGPYATLVSIEDDAGTIKAILTNGVTSIRVYKIDNIT